MFSGAAPGFVFFVSLLFPSWCFLEASPKPLTCCVSRSVPVEQPLALPASLSLWLPEGPCEASRSLQPVAGARL